MNSVADEQRQNLIRGALYSIKMQKDPTSTLKRVALWIALEDMVGDKEFSFRVALSIPKACAYYASNENELKLYSDESAKRVLNRIRTFYYISGARSLQTGREVV